MLDIRKCPTLVINLDRRPDRWEEFKQQPSLKQFTDLQRFSAVDGSKIDTLKDTRISPHTRMNIARKYRRSDYEINTPGAIGASLSHASCWKRLLESKSEYLVVFEDDTLVTEEYLKKIDKLIPTLPEWDMWLLGTHAWGLQGLPLNEDQQGWWRVYSFTGAHAYILNRRGAEILLKEVFPIETHIEYYISACSALKELRLICHYDLRMKYSMELAKSSDSDTFDSYKSCPVCIVPDNFLNTSLYLSSGTLERAVISISALLIIAYGFYLRR
jgi:hypothetical protein